MPDCHKCRWNTAPPSSAKRDACLACPGPADTNHKGRVHVSIDSGDAQTAAEVDASLRVSSADDLPELDIDDPATLEAMELGAMRLLLYFKSLTKEQVVLLWYVLRSKSLADVAARLGRTRAMLSHLWRELVRERPELALVLTGRETAKPQEEEPELSPAEPEHEQLSLF